MSFGPAARAMVEAVTRHFAPGVTLTLRRYSTLANARTSASITAFSLTAAAAEGATSFSMSATDLRGRLISGSQLTITGDPTTYTTTADVDAEAGVLNDIPITPALTQAAAKFAPVNGQFYVDQAYQALEASHDRETASSTIDGVTRRLELVVAAGARAPKEKDLVVSGFSSHEVVVHVSNVEPQQGYPVRWSVLLSSSAGVS